MPHRLLVTVTLLAIVAAAHAGCTVSDSEVNDRTDDAGPRERTSAVAGSPTADDSAARRSPAGDTGIGDILVTLRADVLRSPITAPLEIGVTALNASGEGVSLLIWNTPFEPVLSADLFSIERDGEKRAYRGRKVKRAVPPTEGDIIDLASGETLERIVDLSRYYALDAPGTYEIRFVPRPIPVDGGERGLATLVAADEETVVVERY